MYHIKYIFTIVYFVLQFSDLIKAQEKIGTYEFPIKPGSAEWKAFTSHIQMLEACQIPVDILRIISTNDLVETCLNYPLYEDIFFYDQVQVGFDAVSFHFNGLQELLKRKDGGDLILNKYLKMDINEFNFDWSTLKKAKFAENFFKVEILLAQENILNQFSKIQRELLLKECIKKMHEKEKYPDFFGRFSYVNIGLILGRVLQLEKYTPFIEKCNVDDNLNNFIKVGFYPPTVFIESLLNYSESFLNK